MFHGADREKAFHAEKARTAGLAGEIDVLKARVAVVDRLEQQNKALKEELARLKQSNQQQRSSGRNQLAPRTPLAPVSVNEPRSSLSPVKHNGRQAIESLSHKELLTEHSKLDDKYHKLRVQFGDVMEANQRLKEQCREKSKAYEKWMQHAKTLEGQVSARNKRIEKLKSQLTAATPIGATVSALDTKPARDGVGRDDERTPVPPILETPAGGIRSSPASEPVDTERTQSLPPSLPPLPEVTDAAAYRIPTDEPSSDPPVILYERAVRKRRRDDEQSVYPPPAVKIKTEDGSDPILTNERPCFVPQESIDFDNAEDLIATPRKSRAERTAAGFTASASIRRDISPSLLLARGAASVHSRAPESGLNKQEDLTQNEVGIGRSASRGLHDRSSALYPAPISTPAAKITPRKPKEKTSARSSRRTGIESLAEDGERVDPLSQSLDDRALKRTGRLENLLNNPSPERRTATFTRPSHVDDTIMPERRELPWTKATREAPQGTRSAPVTPEVRAPNRTSSAAKPVVPPVDGERQRTKALRNRPISSLSRNDFRPNPAFNDGLDYAFNEVVRGSDRANLPGCTREECCGKEFRPIALAMLDATGPMEMAAFLETCLGDDARKLGRMTDWEKKDMWIQEKIRELSNKHGRHRERYAGMREPPGFDRMGFPTTQEDEQDRDEGLRREREEVALRYEEARRNGRWLFRDE